MYVELLIKKEAFFLAKDNDVINIKYKQMDKDPELNYSPLNVLTDCLKWEIPANTDVSNSYLSRLCP
ncbi:hypothetical protein GH876_29500 [Bacillus thuringiensis]|nr:hypothetical protein [Bacillus thuringiensis]